MPPEVFTTPYANPVGGEPGEGAREPAAGAAPSCRRPATTSTARSSSTQNGKQLSFELLLNGPTIEAVALAYQASLRKIGIDMQVRSIDTPQWINRVRSRDFDMIYTGWAQSLSPGNEQRAYWGSEAADSESSQNYAGIKDPAVDALIDDDRARPRTATSWWRRRTRSTAC